MLSTSFDMRIVLIASLGLALSGLPTPTQDQQYRERQVLDPESDEWVTRERPAEQGPADDLDAARGLLAESKPRAARKLLKAWLDDVADEERYYEAVWLLGETYFESRDYWRALEQYEIVAENASGELFRLANRRSVDVARAFLSGERRIVWRILYLPARDDGIEILDRVWERMPGTRLGELALKLKADYFFGSGDVDLAQDEYSNLAQQYPSGRYIQLAMLRTAVAAEAAFPGIKFDDLPLVEAEERYRQVSAAFPGYADKEQVPARLEGIRQQRAEKDLEIARWYERTQRPAAAEFYYRVVLRDWPDTLAASEAVAALRAMGVDEETGEEVYDQADEEADQAEESES